MKSEVSSIYTRNFRGTTRYDPPPGYVGNAFQPEPEMKHHVPTDYVTARELPEESPIDIQPAENTAQVSAAVHDEEDSHSAKHPDTAAIEQFISSFVGKIGAEELLILFVMFIVASEGVGVEFLILALILIAG